MEGSCRSSGSVTRNATRSCLRPAWRSVWSKPSSRKSEMRNAMVRFFMAERKCSSAELMSVPLPSGSTSMISRMMRKMWERPFLGGMNRSMRSLNSTAPTLSLFPMALKASTALSSVMRSRFVCLRVPVELDPLTSSNRNTVSSRSSSNTLTYGWPMRAVTFQSMVRISSPCWYSRFSEKAMPRPLNALWYSPEKIRSLSPRVFSSTRRTR